MSVPFVKCVWGSLHLHKVAVSDSFDVISACFDVFFYDNNPDWISYCPVLNHSTLSRTQELKTEIAL